MNLIPTKCKSKIPKDFSYPIGAEAISSVLEGFQHYNELELYFYDRDGYWASKFNKKLQEGGEILVLRFEYHNRLSSFSVSQYISRNFGKHWTIAIYAVPRDKNFIVKNALISDILDKAKDWLYNLEIMKRCSTYEYFKVFFNLGTEQLTIKHS